MCHNTYTEAGGHRYGGRLVAKGCYSDRIRRVRVVHVVAFSF